MLRSLCLRASECRSCRQRSWTSSSAQRRSSGSTWRSQRVSTASRCSSCCTSRASDVRRESSARRTPWIWRQRTAISRLSSGCTRIGGKDTRQEQQLAPPPANTHTSCGGCSPTTALDPQELQWRPVQSECQNLITLIHIISSNIQPEFTSNPISNQTNDIFPHSFWVQIVWLELVEATLPSLQPLRPLRMCRTPHRPSLAATVADPHATLPPHTLVH